MSGPPPTDPHALTQLLRQQGTMNATVVATSGVWEKIREGDYSMEVREQGATSGANQALPAGQWNNVLVSSLGMLAFQHVRGQ